MRYQLGCLHSKLKHFDQALEYLTEFHQYCVKVKDLVSICVMLQINIYQGNYL